MPFADKVKEAVIGKPHDPLNPDTRHNLALVAFLAWIGLGADGLSSSCYGPEEAFLALGQYTHFGLYLEGQYTWVETRIKRATEVRREIGIDWVAQEMDFSGFALHAGLIFTF